jgi:hypothetical protein
MGGLLWGAEIENSDERNGLTVENFLLWGSFVPRRRSTQLR